MRQKFADPIEGCLKGGGGHLWTKRTTPRPRIAVDANGQPKITGRLWFCHRIFICRGSRLCGILRLL